MDADCIAGHNIIGYDLPVIKKIYPWFENPAVVIDTLVLSRLYHPDMISLRQETQLGWHALEALW